MIAFSWINIPGPTHPEATDPERCEGRESRDLENDTDFFLAWPAPFPPAPLGPSRSAPHLLTWTGTTPVSPDSIFQHFTKAFGPPERSQSVSHRSLRRSILVHEWPAFGQHIQTYTTDGYSSIELPGCSGDRRFEFLITARGLSFEAAASIMLSVCRTPVEECLPPAPGETIALEKPIPGSNGMQRVLLSDVPDKEQLGRLQVDGLDIDVLLLVPIFESEFGLCRSRGPGHFWDAFQRESLDLTNLRRNCLRAAHEFVVVTPGRCDQ